MVEENLLVELRNFRSFDSLTSETANELTTAKHFAPSTTCLVHYNFANLHFETHADDTRLHFFHVAIDSQRHCRSHRKPKNIATSLALQLRIASGNG
jgi:hypothetical protein